MALFLDRARASAPDLEVTPASSATSPSSSAASTASPSPSSSPRAAWGWSACATLRDRLDHRLDLLRSHHRRGPARHQTLVDTIDWSYDLLDDDHRRALRWLSVFAGPFDLDAAEAVLGPDSTEQVLGLVERSLLVRPAPPQAGYRMLETVRAFARACWTTPSERRPASPTPAGRRRGRGRPRGMSGRDTGWWSGRVEALLPELALAVSWAVETGRVEEATRIVPDLYSWADSGSAPT